MAVLVTVGCEAAGVCVVGGCAQMPCAARGRAEEEVAE